MLLLPSTTTVLRAVTSAAASVTVAAAYADLNGTTVTVGAPALQTISTATTTTIVAAPASGTTRNVKSVYMTNNSGSVSTQVTVQLFDGTNSVDIMGVTLLPGENLVLTEEGEWIHHDAQGGPYSYAPPLRANLGIAGTLAETHPRELLSETNQAALTSGTLRLQGIYLQAGQTVSNITIYSGTTAAATPTNGFFALYSGASSPALLAQSANFTTEAWAANTAKTKAMTTPYKVPTSGLYYIGILITATTVPTLLGNTSKAVSTITAQAPSLQGNSTTGLTTTLPNPAAAPNANQTVSFYAAVS